MLSTPKDVQIKLKIHDMSIFVTQPASQFMISLLDFRIKTFTLRSCTPNTCGTLGDLFRISTTEVTTNSCELVVVVLYVNPVYIIIFHILP